MTINALNSGAKVWLADQEDANTPLWENVVGGQLNLMDAIGDNIDFTSAEGKEYRLRTDQPLATIVVRPRGWHLSEKHILVDGKRTGGGLVDFALYMVASGQKQIDRGQVPYFYLPKMKMESHLDARLWNDAFNLAQDFLDIPRGTIRAMVLIETYPAAFQMEEILHELRDHSAGLNRPRVRRARPAGAGDVRAPAGKGRLLGRSTRCRRCCRKGTAPEAYAHGAPTAVSASPRARGNCGC